MAKTSLILLGFMAFALPAVALSQEYDDHVHDHSDIEAHDHHHGDGGREAAAENVSDGELSQEFIDARRDALIGLAAQLPGYSAISGVALERMDGDRRLEAIVVSGEDCETDYGCAWTAFSDAPEGWKAIGKGYAHEVSFLRQSGSDGYVIDTDGVQWVYRGGKEIALSTGALARKRPLRPTEADYAVLARVKPEFDDRGEMDLVRYEVDIDLDGDPETVLLVRGMKYGMGTSGHPYLILDGSGNILVDSASPDLPVIFPKEGSGLIVNPAPSGLQILELR